jgi:hypothetical protein
MSRSPAINLTATIRLKDRGLSVAEIPSRPYPKVRRSSAATSFETRSAFVFKDTICYRLMEHGFAAML